MRRERRRRVRVVSPVSLETCSFYVRWGMSFPFPPNGPATPQASVVLLAGAVYDQLSRDPDGRVRVADVKDLLRRDATGEVAMLDWARALRAPTMRRTPPRPRWKTSWASCLNLRFRRR